MDGEVEKFKKDGKSCLRPSLILLFPPTEAAAEWLRKPDFNLQYDMQRGEYDSIIGNSAWEMEELSEADLCHFTKTEQKFSEAESSSLKEIQKGV